jgi:hypothetical protein
MLSPFSAFFFLRERGCEMLPTLLCHLLFLYLYSFGNNVYGVQLPEGGWTAHPAIVDDFKDGLC